MYMAIRNYIIFIFLLVGCVTALAYGLIAGEQYIEKSENWANHTRRVIIATEDLSTSIEALLASQRGYLITQKPEFITDYTAHKKQIGKDLQHLKELNTNNETQIVRVRELERHIEDFKRSLDERMADYLMQKDIKKISDVEVVNEIKGNIIRLNTDIIQSAYKTLNEHIILIETKKKEYFYILLVGLGVGTLLLLIFNWFLLVAQKQRNAAEGDLEDTQQRLELAIEGTRDGIFDWNIKTDQVFYSKQFFAMLGDFDGARETSTDYFYNLIHPDDQAKVRTYADQYLNGEMPEYIQEFRVRHSSGRYLWIQARGKALFDKKGKPYRMVGGLTDVTHMIKVQERLEEEKDAAEKANQAKTDFLAHMSHEIRTPLTAITGIAEIFARNLDGLNDKQKKLVSTLNSSTVALRDLITDVLDFSKIENGSMEIVSEEIEFVPFCEEIISIMAMKASEKNLKFVFDYNDFKNSLINVDKVRLRQILINIIGNAIKFTDKGQIEVKVSSEKSGEQDYLRFDVIDTGIGIAKDRIDLIFERFKQEDSSVSRKFGGTGLGLPISRKLARLMGGDITVMSKKGKGSTFIVMLPLEIRNIDGTSSVATDSSLDRLNEKIRSAVNDNQKILLVDDYEGNVTVIGFMLEDAGLKYDVATNGAEAVEAWNTNDYALVLMDIQMPEMDGFTATETIRKKEAKRKVKNSTTIVGMTAHALVADREKCIEAGMDAYLAKPIDEIEMKRKILELLYMA